VQGKAPLKTGSTTHAKLKMFRCLHGLSQREMGQQLGSNQAAAAKWDAGVYLPPAEAMMDLDIYGWVKLSTPLPPQVFAPVLPDRVLRSQSANRVISSLQEMLPLFCRIEKIAPADIEIVRFPDGDLIRLAGHIVVAIGIARQMRDMLPEGHCPEEILPGEELLSDAIIEKKKLTDLFQKYFKMSQGQLSSVNMFRLKSALWEQTLSLPLTVTIKGIGVAQRQEVLAEIKEIVAKGLTVKHKRSGGAKLTVLVEQ